MIFFEYLAWHFSEGVHEYLTAWRNMHWFLYHFFSVSVLLKTLFQPFHRMQETYSRGFDPGLMLETFIVNTMMRIIGFFIRSVFLLGALVSQIAMAVIGIVFLFVFVASPVLVPILLVLSISLIAA